MAQSDVLKRYLDAGIAFTQLTRQRAEEIVRDLVKAGEVQSDQAQQAVQELIDRSRENSERFVTVVRKEIRDQVGNLGLATRDDIARLEKRIDGLRGGAAGATKKAPAKKSAAKKTAARKTAAKKTSAAKKTAAKKS
jgi:polyhydroxyalkanoate synthesis regulator phasin